MARGLAPSAQSGGFERGQVRQRGLRHARVVDVPVRAPIADPDRRAEHQIRAVETERRCLERELAREDRAALVHVDVLARPGEQRVGRIVPVHRELGRRGQRGDRARLQQVERTLGEGALDVDRRSALGLERPREPALF